MAKKKAQSRLLFSNLYPSHLQDLAAEYLSAYRFDSAIDSGRTGIAYRIQHNHTGQYYCLKTIKPEIVNPDERARTCDSLKKECEILLPLTHKCLPTIHLHKKYGDTYFYICTFHPGTTFHKFRQHNTGLGQLESTFVIRSLMNVLRYIHESGRQHCDLHAGNIMISDNVLQHGIMVIDFGSGHRGSDSSPHTEMRGNINFKTESQKARQNATVNRRDEHFETADFIGLGELLVEMRTSFFKDANPLVKDTYLEFARSLFDRRITRWDVAERAFEAVVDPLRALTLNADIFLSKDGMPQDIPLPVVNNVAVGAPSLDVINTPIFQRLRNVRQLSFCDLFFPGAVHTRFEHSLGVFANAKRAVEHLVHNKRFRNITSPGQTRGFLLASLVHDLGHYPFAHPVEQFAASRLWKYPECRLEAQHARHSAWLLQNDPELKRTILSTWGNEAFIFATSLLIESSADNHLKTLLDGPIDIDKLDYLRRDAHHCGMPYGYGIDVDGLFQSYTVVGGGTKIGITNNGVPAVEGLMVLQDEMLASVYWHPIVRGAICMFHLVLAHIVGDKPTRFKELVRQLKETHSEQEAIDSVITPACEEAGRRLSGNADRNVLKNMTQRLIDLVKFAGDSNFKSVYRPLAEHPRTERTKAVPTTIYRALVRDESHTGDEDISARGDVPIDWNLVKQLRLQYLNALKEQHIEADYTDVVVDVPYGKASRSMVQVVMISTGEEENITSVSNLANSIFTQPAAFASPVRAFISPRVVNQLKEDKLREAADAAEERFLQGAHIEEI